MGACKEADVVAVEQGTEEDTLDTSRMVSDGHERLIRKNTPTLTRHMDAWVQTP
jgi:hypothetical protein